jgi:hypothetical protein
MTSLMVNLVGELPKGEEDGTRGCGDTGTRRKRKKALVNYSYLDAPLRLRVIY